MNHYELLYIVAGKHAEPEVKAVSDSVDSLIAKIGGKVNFTQYWERRKLAYPIDHMTYGHYVITEFDSKPSALIELDRQLRLTLNEVIRHQVVRKDKVGSPADLPRTAAQVEEQRTASAEEVVPAVKEAVVAEEAAEPALKEDTPEVAKPAKAAAAKKPRAEKPAAEEKPAKAAKAEVKAEATEEPAKKKKDPKVSFEDLDKKLDEILNELP